MMFGVDLGGILYSVSVWAIPVLLAITFHEAAHGYVAWRLGDDTAWRLGRVSFNPFRHVDRFGTIVLPALLLLLSGGRFMFGWAKPVPVNFGRLRRPRRDMVLVALAGPGTNIALALACAILFHFTGILPPYVGAWVEENLRNAILLNVLLAVFNMLPLPPLDGGRVAVGLLPDVLAFPLARLERYGFMILIGLVFILPMIGNQIGLKLNLFEWLVLPVVGFLTKLTLILTGHM